jgi:uncharacterized protein (TIGR00156 family)
LGGKSVGFDCRVIRCSGPKDAVLGAAFPFVNALESKISSQIKPRLNICTFILRRRVMNRKFCVSLIFVLILAGSMLNAQEGYRGLGANIVTVEVAKTLRDDDPVTLQGKIERFLGDEKYLFADDTGSIIVEIDNRLWRGFSADQNDTVEITGEVDRGFTQTEIEVSRIKKL